MKNDIGRQVLGFGNLHSPFSQSLEQSGVCVRQVCGGLIAGVAVAAGLLGRLRFPQHQHGLVTQKLAPGVGQGQPAMAFEIDFYQPRCNELAQDGAPCAVVMLLADAIGADLVMPETGNALVFRTQQDTDDIGLPEAFAVR